MILIRITPMICALIATAYQLLSCESRPNVAESHIDYSNLNSQLIEEIAKSIEEGSDDQNSILIPIRSLLDISFVNGAKEVFLLKNAIYGEKVDCSREAFLVVRLKDGRLRQFLSNDKIFIDELNFERYIFYRKRK